MRKHGSSRQQRRHQHAVVVGLEDPEDHEEHADGGQDRSERIEGTRRVRRDRIDDPAAEQDDRRNDHGLKDERRAPADPGRDDTADQRSCRCADATQPADDAEGPGSRREIVEPERRQDVDGRDQQRRPDALQHRVAEDQHAKPRRNRAQQRADPVQHEADGEAALAAPAVGQLAAGDHEDRHDQQEQGDRRLHSCHGRVEIGRDVVDHHVHVRAREAADELSEGERQQESAPRDSRACRCGALSHCLRRLFRGGAAPSTAARPRTAAG